MNHNQTPLGIPRFNVTAGRSKTRYRGLAKNRAQLSTLFALGNLFLVRRRLKVQGRVCPKPNVSPQERCQNCEIRTLCPNKVSLQPSGGNPGEAKTVDQTFLRLHP